MTAKLATDNQHILLADDNENLRYEIVRFLSNIGFNVLTAGDGKTALNIFTHNRGKISLIITDIFMPALDGMGLVRHIRQSDKDFPIVAISGGADSTIQTALDGLGVPLFNKPLDFHAFEKHLASALGTL